MGIKCPFDGTYIQYRLSFLTLSKSGKRIYSYFACPKCGRVLRKGEKVFVLSKVKGGNKSV